MNKLRLLLTLLVVSICSVHNAWADVEINETNFPDANFRSYLLSEDYGSDGVITDAEIAEITYIGVNEKNIANLKGIEFFTALTTLYSSNNQLTALDISKNTALTSLDCSSNQLTALDVSKNTSLTSLSCASNQLTALDISKNTALGYLYCVSNQLTALDVSKNTALETLYCDDNKLTTLNVSGLSVLRTLSCTVNQLSTLNVEGCTTIGEPEKASPTKLSLNCAGNQLKGAAIDALIAALPVRSCNLNIIVNNELEGNVITAAQVAAARAKGWKPMAYNDEYQWWLTYLGAGVPEPEAIEINETNFPDEVFRNYVSQNLDLIKDGKLNFLEISLADNIKVNKTNVQSLKGVEYFTELEGLRSERTQLTTIDVSKNILLTTLAVSENQLTALDLSNNPVLEDIYVAENQLSTLDVSKQTVLVTLECENNKLSTLNLSNNPLLEKLYCPDNQLTALDLSQCPKLYSLRCNNNQIKGTAMDVFIESLPQFHDKWGATEGSFRALTTKPTEGNVMTTTHVAALKAKGWTPQIGIYQGEYEGQVYYNWQEYEGSDPTGIEAVESISSNETTDDAQATWYDLNGRRVTTPTKGVYVKNGKKVVVK